jgi:hypothetical protein
MSGIDANNPFDSGDGILEVSETELSGGGRQC